MVVRRWGMAPVASVACGLLAWLMHAVWVGGGTGDPFGIAMLLGLGGLVTLCALSAIVSLRYRATLELGDGFVISERWLLRGRTASVDRKDLKMVVRPVRWVLSGPPFNVVIAGLFVECGGMMVCLAVDQSEHPSEFAQSCSVWAKRLGKRVEFGERVLAWF